MGARNMYRIEINILEKLCVKLVIYRDHSVVHYQQNVEKQSVYYMYHQV